MQVKTGPNWDDNLAGAPEHAVRDPLLRGIEEKVRMEYQQAFNFYLPRICDHCQNPSCDASCPSGAMYKREEDGVVLVDQDKCRAWRFCVSGCPYKKVYFNHRSGKAEKCTLCYPRLEVGLPTICSETCVGRLRYLGLVLYDADRVEEAASVADPKLLLESQLSLFLDPHDPEVQAAARAEGIADDWIEAATRSPVYKLAVDWKIALPLHPEYRTMPMVWYVPPLSPLDGAVASGAEGYDTDPEDVFPAIERMRIPVEYLANLLAAGDADVIRRVLRRLAAMRGVMRTLQLDGDAADPAKAGQLARSVGMDVSELETMYRLLAIAKYDDRYVIPKAHTELANRLEAEHAGCSLEDGPGGDGPPVGGPGGYGAVGYPTQRKLPGGKRLNLLRENR